MIGDSLHSCDLLREKIKDTLNQEAPVSINKGNAIAKGVHLELDELRAISSSGKEFLEGIEKRESEKQGFPHLKLHLTMFLDIILKFEIRIKTKSQLIGLGNKP